MAFIINQTIDLQRENAPKIYEQALEYGDRNAHEWRVAVTSGGRAKSLAGMSAMFTMKRAAGAAEIEADPTIRVVTVEYPAEIDETGGIAFCVLSGACYMGIGPAVATMKLSGGEEMTTTAVLILDVKRNTTDAVADPTNMVPSIEELLAELGVMRETTQAAQEAADAANEAAGRAPYIDAQTGTWFVWDNAKGTYVDTGNVARGAEGDPGKTPHIGENGNWWIGDSDTGMPARGPAGQNGTGIGTVTGVELNGRTYSPDESGIIILPELGSGDSAGTAEAAVNEHNVDGSSHDDIRQLIVGLTNRLNALADSDDTTLDQLSEIVAYIKSNKSLIDSITTGKVSTADIVDNLTTNVNSKVLSAAQGVVLKGLIDTAVNELKNDKADKTGWTAGKNVVTDADGKLTTEDKPTIPTIPSALPNPFAVTINGQSYDGSKAVEMTVSGLPDGGTAGQVLSKKSDANQDVEWKKLQTDSGANEWKLLGSATNVEGGKQISEILPDEYKELIVKFNDSASPAYLNLTIYIIRAMVTHSTTNVFRTGYYASANEYAEATIEVTLGGVVTFGEYYRKGTKYTDGSVTATVWYR